MEVKLVKTPPELPQIQTYLKSRSLVNDFPETTVIQAPASSAICHGSIVADTGLMSRTSFSMNI